MTTGPSGRRAFLALGAASAAAGVAGCAMSGAPDIPEHGRARTARPSAAREVEALGDHQAGIARPMLPQAHLVSLVLDVRDSPGQLLARLGATIAEVTRRGVDPVPAGDLTVTVGVGPRLVRVVGADLPGSEELPTYAREELGARYRGGDLWVQVCASDPLVCALSAQRIMEDLGAGVTLRWRQSAWRGAYAANPAGDAFAAGRSARNLQGFQDGIVAPQRAEELRESVWIDRPGACRGGTIAVVRRFRLDLDSWRALPVEQQEAAVGRRRESSEPLSGRGAVNLQAKTPAGDYLVPADAHVRRAHPQDVGVPMMLRRSYSVTDPDPGLLFISFQSTLRAFTATMQRLEDSDKMMTFATTTATGTFLVLPGFDREVPLGSSLF